jgi:hypothetical protein
LPRRIQALDGRDRLRLLLETLVGLYGSASNPGRSTGRNRRHLTGFVNAAVDGERLTDEEIAAFFVLFSVAANDTTRQTISHCMRPCAGSPISGRSSRPTAIATCPGRWRKSSAGRRQR